MKKMKKQSKINYSKFNMQEEVVLRELEITKEELQSYNLRSLTMTKKIKDEEHPSYGIILTQTFYEYDQIKDLCRKLMEAK